MVLHALFRVSIIAVASSTLVSYKMTNQKISWGGIVATVLVGASVSLLCNRVRNRRQKRTRNSHKLDPSSARDRSGENGVIVQVAGNTKVAQDQRF